MLYCYSLQTAHKADVAKVLTPGPKAWTCKFTTSVVPLQDCSCTSKMTGVTWSHDVCPVIFKYFRLTQRLWNDAAPQSHWGKLNKLLSGYCLSVRETKQNKASLLVATPSQYFLHVWAKMYEMLIHVLYTKFAVNVCPSCLSNKLVPLEYFWHIKHSDPVFCTMG